MNRAVPRAEIERFTAIMAEKRRRLQRAEHATRGYRDEDGVWRGGLLSFVRDFWATLEPGTEFVEGWALEAVCEHLEAITFGEVTRLLANVPPGFMKSLLTDVFWPAWEWGPMKMPHLRYVAFSYSSSLTQRDNGKFRDLLMSELYQELYGRVFKLRKIGEEKVSNDKHGWKLASSVGGVGTGERGDRIICLPFDTMIFSSQGLLRIGDIVRSKLDVSIAGLDHTSGLIKWQEIEAYESNGIGELIEIEHEDGNVRCTTDHPIYIAGRGYVRADLVQPGECIWSLMPDAMQAMRGFNPSQTEPTANLLQSGLPCVGEDSSRSVEGQQAVRCLRSNGLRAAGPPCQAQGAVLLQPQVPRDTQPGGEQSGISGWVVRFHLQEMRWRIPSKEQRVKESKRRLLFAQMLHSIQMGYWAAKEAAAKKLSALWGGVSAKNHHYADVFEEMCQCLSLGPRAGIWEWALCSRRSFNALSPRVEQSVQGQDTRKGRQSVSPMLANAQRESRDASRSSYRLCKGQPRSNESDHGMQILSRIDARQEAIPAGLDKKTVLSVKRIGRAETFNIRVRPCHNYFADGVLVHNCDDPHNVKESESDVVRKETVRWFRESMSSRLNNMETGAKIVIMQRVNEEDVSGTITKELRDYCHLMIPMEMVWQADDDGNPYSTDIGWVDPRWTPDPEDCEGALAWPERFPERIIPQMKRDAGQYAWSSQYQQVPNPRGGGIFQRDHWMPAEPVMSGEKYPPLEYIVASLDGAYTEKEENDPSALTIWGIFQNEQGYNRALLIHAWRKRLEFSGPRMDVLPGEHESQYILRTRPYWGLVEWVAYSCNRFKCDRLLIESKASGISAAQSLRNSHGRAGWSIQLVEPKGDKMARAIAVQPSFSQGMIYAPDREWSEMVQDEMAKFPRDKHDDLCDSAVQALKHLRDSGLLRSDEDRRAEEMEAVRHKGAPKERRYPGFSKRQR